jgi:quercetin dioxygenase-like cupin family protein
MEATNMEAIRTKPDTKQVTEKPTEKPYVFVDALPELLDAIQPDSIISRTFCKGEQVRATIFGFDAGQELTEHTSSHTAILQIVQGEATVTLGDDTVEIGSGGWVYMPPRLKHSVRAKTKVIMLLEMFD